MYGYLLASIAGCGLFVFEITWCFWFGVYLWWLVVVIVCLCWLMVVSCWLIFITACFRFGLLLTFSFCWDCIALCCGGLLFDFVFFLYFLRCVCWYLLVDFGFDFWFAYLCLDWVFLIDRCFCGLWLFGVFACFAFDSISCCFWVCLLSDDLFLLRVVCLSIAVITFAW